MNLVVWLVCFFARCSLLELGQNKLDKHTHTEYVAVSKHSCRTLVKEENMSHLSPHVAYGIRPSQGSLLTGILICMIAVGLLTAIFF